MTRGIAREGFDKDLLFGQAREDAFIRTVLGGAFVEHKADEKARETGNLFIEFETSALPDGFGEKTPSGIAVTTSQRWAHEIDDDCWILMPTERIMRLVDTVRGGYGKSVWAGDFNRFHGALIPWSWLLRPPAERNTTNGQLTL